MQRAGNALTLAVQPLGALHNLPVTGLASAHSIAVLSWNPNLSLFDPYNTPVTHQQTSVRDSRSVVAEEKSYRIDPRPFECKPNVTPLNLLLGGYLAGCTHFFVFLGEAYSRRNSTSRRTPKPVPPAGRYGLAFERNAGPAMSRCSHG